MHFQWSTGVLYNEVKSIPSAKVYFSEVPGESYNFLVPDLHDPGLLELETIRQLFQANNKKPCVILHNEHQNEGFTELLVRNGYKSHGEDCWVLLDVNVYKNREVGANVVEVTPDTFKDYYSVLSPVFSDFPGNEKYLELCLKSIKGELKSNCSDLISKLFLIYDSGKPVAGAGMFYSKSADIAYLHDAGTLPEFRGKGYQTALLKHRANIALSQYITRVYSSVEPGSQSWSNCIKVGFNQTPWQLLMVAED